MNEIAAEFDGEIVDICAKKRRDCGIWTTFVQSILKRGKMDKEQIKKYLPHREPMLLVDEVKKKANIP